MLADAFKQEKALVGAFSVITNLRMEIFQALVIKFNIGNLNTDIVLCVDILWQYSRQFQFKYIWNEI